MAENKFREWVQDQPRAVTHRIIAKEIGVDPSYVSDLTNPNNKIMPSLQVAVKISRLTKGRVTPEDMHDLVMANRGA